MNKLTEALKSLGATCVIGRSYLNTHDGVIIVDEPLSNGRVRVEILCPNEDVALETVKSAMMSATYRSWLAEKVQKGEVKLPPAANDDKETP